MLRDVLARSAGRAAALDLVGYPRRRNLGESSSTTQMLLLSSAW